jgi:hypothetical protein
MSPKRLGLLLNVLLVSIFMTPSDRAEAHARIAVGSNLPPRSTSPGLKTAPCGGVIRTNIPTILQAGTTMTVSWEETINHPGQFEFSFSKKNDLGFTPMKLSTDVDAVIIDTQNGTNDLPHQFSATIKIPTENCAACTIRLIQVMTENPDNPTYYYSCADVQIVGGTAEPVDPPPPPTGLPPDCN